jgi:hypothetical protein
MEDPPDPISVPRGTPGGSVLLNRNTTKSHSGHDDSNPKRFTIQLDIQRHRGLIVFARSGLYQNILVCQKCNNDPACVFAVSPAPVGFVKDPFFVSSYR